jgi:hypothetical protein
MTQARQVASEIATPEGAMIEKAVCGRHDDGDGDRKGRERSLQLCQVGVIPDHVIGRWLVSARSFIVP